MSGSVFFGQKSGRSIYIDIVKKKAKITEYYVLAKFVVN